MRSYRAASVLIVLLAFPLYAQAAPAPIVFDFEAGLQGWELGRTAQRVQTQVLGGEWAILGDGPANGGASISIEIDLTDIASVSVEQFSASESPVTPWWRSFLILGVSGPSGGQVTWLTFPSEANPNTISSGLGRFEGVYTIEFHWWPSNAHPHCIPHPCAPPPDDYLLGFLDNITFHPVSESSSRLLAPEPSSWLLLSLGIAGMVMIRRKLASRA